jgi:ribosomal protein S14
MFISDRAKEVPRRSVGLWNNSGMAETIHCSFCGKPRGKVLELVLARNAPSAAGICDACVGICARILVKSGTGPIVETPRSYYRLGAREPERNQLSCSFCGTPQHKAHRLIGSSPGLTPAYICGKCVALCEMEIGSGRRAGPAENAAAPVRDWVARKTGKHETTIHHIG